MLSKWSSGADADLLAGLLMMQFMMYVFSAHSASGTPLGCCTPSRTLSLSQWRAAASRRLSVVKEAVRLRACRTRRWHLVRERRDESTFDSERAVLKELYGADPKDLMWCLLQIQKIVR